MLIQGFVRVLHAVLERLSKVKPGLLHVIEVSYFEHEGKCPFGNYTPYTDNLGTVAKNAVADSVESSAPAFPVLAPELLRGIVELAAMNSDSLRIRKLTYKDSQATVEDDVSLNRPSVSSKQIQCTDDGLANQDSSPPDSKGVSLLDVLRLLNPELNDSELSAMRETLNGKQHWKDFRSSNAPLGKFWKKGVKGKGEKLYPVKALLEYAKKAGLWDGREFPEFPRELKRLLRVPNR